MLTNAEIEAIRERAEKATKGRWYYEVDGDLYSDKTRDRVMYPYMSSESIPYIKISESDATFIAYARQDIPKLLAEIGRYRAAMTELNREADDLIRIGKDVERYAVHHGAVTQLIKGKAILRAVNKLKGGDSE